MNNTTSSKDTSLPILDLVRHGHANQCLTKRILRVIAQRLGIGATAARSAIPSLYDYLARANNLYDRDHALQSKYPSAQHPDFTRFIDTEAILFYREIQEVGIPFPLSREMLTVGGETDLRLFLSIGYSCYQIIMRHLPNNLPKKARILDFGVGCARTARFFFRNAEQFDCYGCDVDDKAIEYTANALPFIKAVTSCNRPPLPYGNDSFDVVYSISVFTHLNYEAFMVWLTEMHRILAKGGILQISLHGQRAFTTITNDPLRRRLIGISDKEFETTQGNFQKDGFVWMSQPVGSSSIDTSQFGISFITRDQFENSIKGMFSLVSYNEGEIGGWQDLAVISKATS